MNRRAEAGKRGLLLAELVQEDPEAKAEDSEVRGQSCEGCVYVCMDGGVCVYAHAHTFTGPHTFNSFPPTSGFPSRAVTLWQGEAWSAPYLLLPRVPPSTQKVTP